LKINTVFVRRFAPNKNWIESLKLLILLIDALRKPVKPKNQLLVLASLLFNAPSDHQNATAESVKEYYLN
jgi:hypothetical protein